MYHMCCLLQHLVDRRPFQSEQGVTAIEYALAAGIMALAIVTGMTAFGVSLSTLFNYFAAQFHS
jgi:pilus assembly protein Flp/PilA